MSDWGDLLKANSQYKQPREKIRFPYLYFTRYAVKDQDMKDAAINNISESGACMLIPEQLNEGQVVWVEVPLSRIKTSVRTLAEVRWSVPISFWREGSFVGLRFLI